MKRKRKILTVIPARGGSKGITRKNIRPLAGRPLVSYVIEAATKAKLVERLIVSTDDTEIADVARSFGADIPFMRPPEVATDTTTLILVMRHALQYFDNKGERYDAVLSLQPTSPLIKPQTIDRIIDKFHETECEAAATVSRVSHGHPYVSKRLIGENKDQIESFVQVPEGAVLFPRQKREPAYCYNGAIYLRDRKLVDNFSGRDWGLGKDPRVVIMDSYESVDIDEMVDLITAEAIINEKRNN